MVSLLHRHLAIYPKLWSPEWQKAIFLKILSYLTFNLLFGTSRTFCIFAYQIHSHYAVASDGETSLVCCDDRMTVLFGAIAVLVSSPERNVPAPGGSMTPGVTR